VAFVVQQLLYVDQHQATLVIGPVGVVVWRGEASLTAVQRVRDLGLFAAEVSPRGFGMIGVVEATAKAPTSESRQLSAAINDELARRGATGFAAIVPQPGFAGAWIRAVVTSLNWLARNQYSFKAYESTEQACRWLLEPLTIDAGECQQIVSQLDAFREDYGKAWSSGSFQSLRR
jgi:hypothetical protein